MQNTQKPIDQKENAATETEDAHKHTNDLGSNEKVIKKVLEIEKEADKVHDKAVHEAEQLPIRADQDAQAIIDKARIAAQEEAAKMVDQAQVQQQSAEILADAEKSTQNTESLASNNFNRAVAYVVARVIGRE